MDKNKTILLTPQGQQELLAELEDIKKNKLPAVIDRVSKAREFGDLSENAEYHAARDDHAWIQGRLEELEAVLAQAQIIETGSGGPINIGSRVVVNVNGTEHEFHIVGEWEADPAAKKISHESPLGKALVGKTAGEKVEVEAPAGKIIYHIKAVK